MIRPRSFSTRILSPVVAIRHCDCRCRRHNTRVMAWPVVSRAVAASPESACAGRNLELGARARRGTRSVVERRSTIGRIAQRPVRPIAIVGMATLLGTATGERPHSDRPRSRSLAGRSSPRKLLGALRGPSCRQHLRRMTGGHRSLGLEGLRRGQSATPGPSSAAPIAAQPAVAQIWSVLSGTATVCLTTAVDCPRIVSAVHRGSHRGRRTPHRLWVTQPRVAVATFK